MSRTTPPARRDIDYLDFAVLLHPDGTGAYEARVVNAPFGSHAVTFTPPAWPQGGAAMPSTAEPGRDFSLPLASPPPPEETGSRLFEAVFHGPLHDTLQQSLAVAVAREETGLRLRLVFAPHEPDVRRLLDLPWELLRRPDTGQYLALSRYTPLVRYIEVAQSRSTPPLPDELHILAAIATPRGLPPLDAETEAARLLELGSRPHIRVEVIEHTTLDDLRRALAVTRYQVLHFVGHGTFDERQRRGLLIFEDDRGGAAPVPAELVARLVTGDRSLRLAVLNACQTAVGSTGKERGSLTGTVEALLAAGLPAAVAMRKPIRDGAAIAFSGAFYESLAAGASVERAATEGRLAIDCTRGGEAEWAIPAVYMSVADGHLFAVPAERKKAHRDFEAGLEALCKADYPMAITRFRRAREIDEVDDEARYLEALALLGGRHPRALDWRTAQGLTRQLAAALASGRPQAHVLYLLALIKADYFERSGLKVAPPSSRDLLRQASALPVDSERLRELLRHLPEIDDNPVYRQLRQACGSG